MVRCWRRRRGVSVVGGLVHTLVTGTEIPPPAVLAAVTALVVLGHILVVRVRTGTGTLNLGWGEAALIVACYFVPVGLVPALFLVAVGLQQYGRLRAGRVAAPFKVVNNTAALTVSAAAAATTAALIGLRPEADLDGRTLLALVAGGAAFLVFSAGDRRRPAPRSSTTSGPCGWPARSSAPRFRWRSATRSSAPP